MKRAVTVAQVRGLLAELRGAGAGVSFVPTMGGLHEGHASLVERARQAAPAVVLSVFVNPLQFGPDEDLAAYPRDPQRDARLAQEWGVAVLFTPSSEFLPAEGGVRLDPGPLGGRLEGAVRPDHFRGVLTIVAKLLNVVRPDVAVFGQKDLQQAVLVRHMVRDLDVPVRIDVGATVREPDGLALSSRNAYLTAAERADAPALQRALLVGEAALLSGQREPGRVREAIVRALDETPSLHPDYVAVLRAEDLAESSLAHGPTALLAAARLGRTRLIDNRIVDVGGAS
ncbi:MAG: pantoate--beta-alanine ligase [Gemmatimonadetes bacterium]|nr:pantoate--beta-alanine ligase [Gemmatimonadota bacterium]